MNRRTFLRSLLGAAVCAVVEFSPLAKTSARWWRPQPPPRMTLVEWAKRVDPEGSVAQIAQLLAQSNDILGDMVFEPAVGQHRAVITTALPVAMVRDRHGNTRPLRDTEWDSADLDDCGCYG